MFVVYNGTGINGYMPSSLSTPIFAWPYLSTLSTCGMGLGKVRLQQRGSMVSEVDHITVVGYNKRSAGAFISVNTWWPRASRDVWEGKKRCENT